MPAPAFARRWPGRRARGAGCPPAALPRRRAPGAERLGAGRPASARPRSRCAARPPKSRPPRRSGHRPGSAGLACGAAGSAAAGHPRPAPWARPPRGARPEARNRARCQRPWRPAARAPTGRAPPPGYRAKRATLPIEPPASLAKSRPARRQYSIIGGATLVPTFAESRYIVSSFGIGFTQKFVT